MRGERRATTVGDGADVGAGEQSPIEEGHDFELTLDVYDVRNVGVGMGVDEDDWEKVLEKPGPMHDSSTNHLLKRKTMDIL